jgi:aminoacyl-tRNA hydrolase
MRSMNISLIIPAYNEAPVIVATLHLLRVAFEERFTAHGFTWEIIVVDNASTDNTALAVRKICDERIHAHYIPQKGKGRAVRKGVDLAQGVVVGFTDADLSVAPEEIAEAFLRVLSGETSVVIGSRAHPESMLPGREWWRTGSSTAFNLLSRWVVGTSFRDTQCPLKVMDARGRSIFLATVNPTWFFDVEFLALAERLGVHVVEIPVMWSEHRYPERLSKLSTVKDGARSVAAAFRIRRRLPAQLAELRKMFSMSPSMQWIIVGLGNPGGEYERTRHNAGRIVLEELRRAYDLPEWEYKKTYDAKVSKGVIAGMEVLFVEPETFMNASGKSLRLLVKHPEQAARLIVLHDDVDLPIGSWRFASFGRGSGGQKGVESIMSILKTRDFVRVRIGVGESFGGGVRRKASDIVLEKMRSEDLALVQAIGQSADLRTALESLLQNGLEFARSQWKKWNVTLLPDDEEKKTTM